jgi:hypothetical protein
VPSGVEPPVRLPRQFDVESAAVTAGRQGVERGREVDVARAEREMLVTAG